MKIPNLIFQEITKEESVKYLADNDLICTPQYPGNPGKLPGEIGFHTKKRIRLVVTSLPIGSVFTYKRRGVTDRNIAKEFGLNLKSKFRTIIK